VKLPIIKGGYSPGDVALSCNPSYWGARTVEWLEAARPLLRWDG